MVIVDGKIKKATGVELLQYFIENRISINMKWAEFIKKVKSEGCKILRSSSRTVVDR